jgi:hypothetical protein
VRCSLDPLDQVTAGASSLPWRDWDQKINPGAGGGREQDGGPGQARSSSAGQQAPDAAAWHGGPSRAGRAGDPAEPRGVAGAGADRGDRWPGPGRWRQRRAAGAAGQPADSGRLVRRPQTHGRGRAGRADRRDRLRQGGRGGPTGRLPRGAGGRDRGRDRAVGGGGAGAGRAGTAAAGGHPGRRGRPAGPAGRGAPGVGSLRLAVLYASASAEASIGGDFYEALETPHGVRLLGRGRARQRPGRGPAGRGGAGQLPRRRPGPPPTWPRSQRPWTAASPAPSAWRTS